LDSARVQKSSTRNAARTTPKKRIMHEFDWLTLTLAQETELPPASGSAPPPAGTTSAESAPLPNTGPGGTGAPPPSIMNNSFFVIMLLLLGGMILFSIMGQRRDRKKREAMISAIKKHDRVQTIGGVIGSVVEVKPDYVILKVDESSNTRITFARSAIQQVLNVSDEGAVLVKSESGK
jgi:preprotein translocase subunit YajC